MGAFRALITVFALSAGCGAASASPAMAASKATAAEIRPPQDTWRQSSRPGRENFVPAEARRDGATATRCDRESPQPPS